MKFTVQHLHIIIAFLLLSSCSELLMENGSSYTPAQRYSTTRSDEKPIDEESMYDTTIKENIRSKLWFIAFHKMHVRVEKGRVIYTGLVENEEDMALAIDTAWQQEGVKDVVNKLRVPGIDDHTIKTKIENELYYLLQDFRNPSKVNVQVVEGKVIYTGFIRKAKDMQSVLKIAWQQKGVKEVINLLKVVNNAP